MWKWSTTWQGACGLSLLHTDTEIVKRRDIRIDSLCSIRRCCCCCYCCYSRLCTVHPHVVDSNFEGIELPVISSVVLSYLQGRSVMDILKCFISSIIQYWKCVGIVFATLQWMGSILYSKFYVLAIELKMSLYIFRAW